MAEQPKLPLGKLLIQKGVISEDQLRIALIEQQRSSEPLGKLLITPGFRHRSHGARGAQRKPEPAVSADLANLVGRRHRPQADPEGRGQALPRLPDRLRAQADNLILAMADTSNIVALDQISAMLVKGITISTVLVGRIRHLARHRPVLRLRTVDRRHPARNRNRRNRLPEPGIAVGRIQPADGAPDRCAAGRRRADTAPPTSTSSRKQSFLRIRYRIDGVLRQIRSLHKTYWPAMAVRLKVMSAT